MINGGRKLAGDIIVNGAKNAALKFFAASLLSQKPWIIKNVPDIEDIQRMAEILRELGISIQRSAHDVYNLQAFNIKNYVLNAEQTRKLRASIVLTAPLLARGGRVEFYHPGGCLIGQRPIDLFLEGFKAFGAKIQEYGEKYIIAAKNIKGARFFFRQISVTATETLMLLGVLAQGRTILENAAQEPEIKSLADFLNKCGAKIRGAGTSTIIVDGIKTLGSDVYTTMPDRIEAGSFAILAAVTQSRIKIRNCNPNHLNALWQVFKEMGINFFVGKDYVIVNPASTDQRLVSDNRPKIKSRKIKSVNIKTHEYPGFATDLQPPITVLLTQAQGLSMIHETVYEGRLFYTDILTKMNAHIILCDPHRVIVNGPTKLTGTKVFSPDIRAGIALIIAGLVAKGVTVIENIYQVDRGYERIDERLRMLGADIRRIND